MMDENIVAGLCSVSNRNKTITGLIINTLLRPVLIFFSIPFIILTLGLFLFVLNALLLQFAAVLVSGFSIDGFWWAVAGSVVISAISWILGALFNL